MATVPSPVFLGISPAFGPGKMHRPVYHRVAPSVWLPVARSVVKLHPPRRYLGLRNGSQINVHGNVLTSTTDACRTAYLVEVTCETDGRSMRSC